MPVMHEQMAASSSSFSSSAPKESKYFTLDSTSHPYPRAQVADYARHYAICIPMKFLQKGADNLRYKNGDPTLAQPIRESFNLLWIFGAIAKISSCSVGVQVNDGQTYSTRYTGAITMIPSRKVPGEYSGMVFTYSYACHPTEQPRQDEEPEPLPKEAQAQNLKNKGMLNEPSQILFDHLSVAAVDTRASLAGYHVGRTEFRKLKAAELSMMSEERKVFHTLDREKWSALAKAYSIVGRDKQLELDEKSAGSVTRLENVFSIQNALRHAEVEDGDPEFCDPRNWLRKKKDGSRAPMLLLRFPQDGAHTWKIKPGELDPDFLSRAILPHIEPAEMTLENEGMRHYTKLYYGQDLPEDELKLTAEESKRLEYAKQQAAYALRRSGGSIDDGSIDRFAERCRKEKAAIIEEHAKLKALAERAATNQGDGTLPTRILQAINKTQSIALEEWEDKKISELFTRITEHNEQLSQAEAGIAKWIKEWLVTSPNGFSMPKSPEFKDLTDFGNLAADWSLYAEVVHRVHTAHAHFAALMLAVLSTSIGSGMRFHVMFMGGAEGGKSFLLRLMHKMCTPGTSHMLTASSAKAELVESNRFLDMAVVFQEEAVPSQWAIGAGNAVQNGGSNKSAQNNANHDIAAIFRNMLTSNEANYRRNDAIGNGERVGKQIHVKGQTTFAVGVNGETTDLADNMRTRVYTAIVEAGKRRDVSLGIKAMSGEGASRDNEALITAFSNRFRRDQVMIFVISWFMKCGFVDEVCTVATDALLLMTQEELKKRGCVAAEVQVRSSERLLLAMKCCAFIEAIYLVFDAPQRVFNNEESWVEENWKKMKRHIRFFLRTTPDHFFFTVPLLSGQWEDPLRAQIVHAFDVNYNLQITSASRGLLHPGDKSHNQRQWQMIRAQAEKKNQSKNNKKKPQHISPFEIVLDAQGKEVEEVNLYPIIRERPILELEESDEIIWRDTVDPTSFLYFHWKPTASSSVVPPHWEREDRHVDADKIQALAQHWQKLASIPDTRINQFKKEIMEMMAARIPAVKQADNTLVEESALKWVSLKIGEEHKVFLRIHREFFCHQATSVVDATLDQVAHSWGLPQQCYVKGRQDKDRAYLWQVLRVDPLVQRHPLKLQNVQAINSHAHEMVSRMLGSASNSKDMKGEISRDIRRLLEPEMQRCKTIVLSKPRHSLMRLVAELHAARIGPRGHPHVDYRGKSFNHRVYNPDEQEKDLVGAYGMRNELGLFEELPHFQHLKYDGPDGLNLYPDDVDETTTLKHYHRLMCQITSFRNTGQSRQFDVRSKRILFPHGEDEENEVERKETKDSALAARRSKATTTPYPHPVAPRTSRWLHPLSTQEQRTKTMDQPDLDEVAVTSVDSTHTVPASVRTPTRGTATLPLTGNTHGTKRIRDLDPARLCNDPIAHAVFRDDDSMYQQATQRPRVDTITTTDVITRPFPLSQTSDESSDNDNDEDYRGISDTIISY